MEPEESPHVRRSIRQNRPTIRTSAKELSPSRKRSNTSNLASNSFKKVKPTVTKRKSTSLNEINPKETKKRNDIEFVKSDDIELGGGRRIRTRKYITKKKKRTRKLNKRFNERLTKHIKRRVKKYTRRH